MKPKIISTQRIHTGKIFDVVSTTILEGDKEHEREIVTHGGSSVIVPVFEDNTVAMVSQYRHAAEKYLLELPAGTIDTGESPEECARREVEEEIGFRANIFKKLTEFYVSPGFLDEKMHVFLATDLIQTKQNLDEDEILSVARFSFEEAFSKIARGEIEDAKTIVGLILAGKTFGADF